MSLRSRLTLALTAAAVLPMIVVVGAPLLRIEGRLRKESTRRIELAVRQAAFLVERAHRDAAARVERAAAQLAVDRTAQESVLGGPEDAALVVARGLAERHGLDHLELLTDSGSVLAETGAGERAGARGLVADVPEGGVVVRAVLAGDGAAPAFYRRAAALRARESIVIVGGVEIGHGFVQDVAEMTGGAAAILDADRVILEAPALGAEGIDRVSADVPLGGGSWRIRVWVPAADIRSERRDLLTAFAGVTPLALLSALGIGVLLADRISRPIRALAERADEISSGRSAFALVEPERDEVRRLTRSFDRMIDSLADSEKERLAAERVAAWQQVARRIAHEVRNPLSPIQLAVENLRRVREKAPEKLDAALAEETTTILEEVESLKRLVDEFSRFARLPSPAPASCDPAALVQQALVLLAPRIASLGVQVELDRREAPESFVADPDLIGRVLKNVLGNALDALEGESVRRLQITLRREGEAARARLRIEVRDSGVGLDGQARARIFEPYFTTRADKGGTGLGMAIVERIVMDHGGTIDAQGAPGRGATITILLPLDAKRA